MNGKDVAQELEAQIREAIERMVADIRSSIDDVREVVDQQLTAALQSVQADANTSSFRTILDNAVARLAESSPETPARAASTVPRASRVKRSIQMIESGRSQVDVLNALLDQALQFGSRAALLILKGETFAGWKGLGYARFGVDDDSIKRFSATPGTVPELDRLLRDERSIDWTGDRLSQRLGVDAPASTLAVPMVIKDKIAAAVIVEVSPEEVEKFDRDAIELLVFTTGLLIDTLAIRRKVPSPSLSRLDPGADTASISSTIPPAAPAPAPSAPSVPVAPPVSFNPPPAPVAPPAPQPPPPAPPEPAAEEKKDDRRTESGGRQTPGSAGGNAADLADRPSTQYVPPAGIQRNFQRTAGQGEDARKQDEARRFARLLVSEIKLYNESKVEQGRKNRDLYERLREDIDRSRQMYDDRIPDEVRKSSNYFYDEMVRILADGDPEVLGL